MGSASHFLFSAIFAAMAMNAANAAVSNALTERFLIEMEVEDKAYKAVQRAKPSDVVFDGARVRINGDDFATESVRTRGKSSLLQRRKSYTVELRDSVEIPFGNEIKTLRAFYLISMSMDKNYFRNRLSFECLAYLGLFPMKFRYVNLKINGQHEGIYLLVQRPFDCLIDEKGSPYVLRRLKSGVIDKDKASADSGEEEIDGYRENFKSLVKSVRRLEGETLWRELDRQVNMDSYFKWLAFNYLIRNGDYTDEVYYYVIPEDTAGRFDIVPWDFDDILKKGPHEGIEQRDKVLGEKIIFSSEDVLDRIIANDHYVYTKYLDTTEKVLEQLSDEFLALIFSRILADLTPYFESPEIIATSSYDEWGPANIEQLREELDKIERYLISRKKDMASHCHGY